MFDITSKARRGLLLLAALSILHACSSLQGSGLDSGRGSMPKVGTIAVAGFIPGVEDGGGAGRVRSSFTGYVFDAEPVSADVADKMTALLFERIVGLEGLTFYSPDQSAAVRAGIIKSQKGLTMDQPSLYRETGRLMQADAVLVGFVYRWRERVGSDYGVSSPASVAFDLQLLLTEDGRVIWKGKFDKTQRSLSEDLFDLNTFVKARGRWMSVEQLALTGLEALLERLKSDLKGAGSELPLDVDGKL